MSRLTLIALGLLLGLLPAGALAQPTLHSGVAASGGATAHAGVLTLSGTLGQPLAGRTASAEVVLGGGFWPRVAARRGTISTDDPASPYVYALDANYPNPFASTTRIAYEVAEPVHVRLVVYNLLGQEVAVLTDEPRPAGRHEVEFAAPGLASGMYLYRLTAGDFRQARRMLLVR